MLKVHALTALLAACKPTRRHPRSADNLRVEVGLKSLRHSTFVPWEWVDASHAWGVSFGPRDVDPDRPWVPPSVDSPVPFELTPRGWAA